jgi:hypothetical protein
MNIASSRWPCMSSVHRPGLVTWLSIGVLTLSAIQAGAFLGALKLPELQFSIPRWYFLVRSISWSILGLVGAFALFRGLAWSPWATLIGSYAIAAWYWLERLLFARSDHELQSRPLAAVLTLVILFSITLAFRRRNVRDFFAERVP